MTSTARVMVAGCWAAIVTGLLLAGTQLTGIAEPPPPELIAFDPGAVTRWGAPLLRFTGTTAAVLAVGTLLGLVILDGLPRHRTTVLSLRRATRLLACSAVVALIMQVLLGISAIVGRPALTISVSDYVACLTMPGILYCLGSIAGFLCLAMLIRTRTTPLNLLVVGMVATCLPFAGGHPSSASNHIVSLGMIVLHVLAAALWVGGLAMLLIVGGILGDRVAMRTVLPKFSRLALPCAIATAVSGFGSLLAQAPEVGGYSRNYLLLVLVKAIGLVGLFWFGAWHRRHSVPASIHDPLSAKFLRTGLREVALMSAIIAVATVLSRTPPGSFE
ncbi:copper resistance D family protein [Nocardia suismassiliense]|uniref:Copper resistance D family protein n=1 Tax=Nocardia suismassiliense TaxID=2077092 RepID=A0ABW6R0T4_9NOCA